jgi:hypothetical protein
LKQRIKEATACHSWCSWLSVAGNGIKLSCLQSKPIEPTQNFDKYTEKKSELFLNLIHVYFMYLIVFNTYNLCS